MARVKDILEAQKAVICTLWEAGQTQKEIAVCCLKDIKMKLFKMVKL